MRNTLLILIILLVLTLSAMAQNIDSTVIANIYKNALTSRESYSNLKVLCDSAGPGLMGSEESVKAVKILNRQLKNKGFDTAFQQEFETTAWVCNTKSKALVSLNENQNYALEVDALGPSVSTKKEGLKAEVIEVNNISELESLGEEKIKGKIVFFNTPMKNSYPNPVDAYVEVRKLRFNGTSKAAKYGAVGVLMRSITTAIDEFPHTGSIVYDEKFQKIPALAVSSKDSDALSKMLKTDPSLTITIFVDSKVNDPVKSYNVIAEIRGKTKPDEVIIIGAHIDSWYNAPGAHDDGAGCVQVMDVLRIFNELKINNNRTIRVVLFMDEEIDRSGAKAYADYISSEKEKIIAGLESDLGGYAPNGFLIDAPEPVINQIQAYKNYLLPYGLYNIGKGFGGMDILVLKNKFDFPSIALRVESQRYFEIIHTVNDTFDKVHPRELQLGTAAIASLVYLIDKYGVNTAK